MVLVVEYLFTPELKCEQHKRVDRGTSKGLLINDFILLGRYMFYDSSDSRRAHDLTLTIVTISPCVCVSSVVLYGGWKEGFL